MQPPFVYLVICMSGTTVWNLLYFQDVAHFICLWKADIYYRVYLGIKVIFQDLPLKENLTKTTLIKN